MSGIPSGKPSCLGTLSFMVLVFALYEEVNGHVKDNPYTFLDVTGMIVFDGYTVETYIVVTEDGYALTIHRIPHGRGKRNSTGCGKQVVLLQHGIGGSSIIWLYAGKNNSLAYELADQGYDVWLPNIRGNEYSSMYTPQRDPRTKEFWDFSLHENGVYDFPAVIDFILEKTGKQKMVYLGHSLAITIFCIMMSQRPEYNKKISVLISLAPAVYMDHYKIAVKNALALLINPLTKILNWTGITHIIPLSQVMSVAANTICSETREISYVCKILLTVLRFDLEGINQTLIPVYLTNVFAGASTKQLIHLAQSIVSGHFCQYDYGECENLNHYNSTQPSCYNISKTEVPVAIFYANDDTTANKIDVMKLSTELPNVIELHKVPEKNFNHLDFFVHKDIATLINKPVIDILDLYCTQ